MTSVRIQGIGKKFGDVVALRDINLDIDAGELFFLLGPSGCGKTTLLRLIAGLTDASAGRIFFNNRDVTGMDTEHRNAVMCFQGYALWPHMSVRENVRFGLGVRGAAVEEQKRRVDQVLKLVQMLAHAGKKPNQLSGGQQQRVALARALAVEPDCLLLDEPLSNLDTKLRLEMRGEIRRICKSAGFTTIYVTHDQKEAMSVADRIAILKDGKVAQVGTPAEVYLLPQNSFVADFMGATNLLPGKIMSRNGERLEIETPVGMLSALGSVAGPKVILSVRPERIRIVNQPQAIRPAGTNRLVGIVRETVFLGDSSEHVLQVNEVRLKIVVVPPMWQPPGELAVEFEPADVVVLSE